MSPKDEAHSKGKTSKPEKKRGFRRSVVEGWWVKFGRVKVESEEDLDATKLYEAVGSVGESLASLPTAVDASEASLKGRLWLACVNQKQVKFAQDTRAVGWTNEVKGQGCEAP